MVIIYLALWEYRKDERIQMGPKRGWRMKKILVLLLLCFGLMGCQTLAQKINSVSLGMSKDEVINIMGQPVSTCAIEGKEYLNYKLFEYGGSLGSGEPVPYFVRIKDGKVDAYGRRGDFGTTQLPAQVIKVAGDLQSNENINIKSDDELATKIKTINRLLSDGLITKKEFEEQRQKLLDEYTGKKN